MFLLKARILGTLNRQGVPLIGLTVLLSATIAITGATVSDIDTALGWALVGASILLAVLLGFLAWSGTEDVRDLAMVDALHGTNQDEHARWIGWFERQRREHDERLTRLEGKVDDLLASTRGRGG